MRRFFTSDLHLGSSTILGYAHRPFKSAEEALATYLCNINGELTPHDTLIHVGDFMLSGADRHGKVEDIGLKWTQNDYLDMFNCNIILLSGNHDDGHSCETIAKYMVIDLNQNWRNVTVGHYPSTSSIITHSRSGRKVITKNSCGYCGWKGTEQHPHVHLCGHVHNSWFICWDEDNHVLNYNVGIDSHRYKPVCDAEITSDLDYLWNGKIQAPNVMTRKEFEEWKKKNEAFVEAERQRRKEEKYKKRGLTPEICQQRKEEALRKKGIIK